MHTHITLPSFDKIASVRKTTSSVLSSWLTELPDHVHVRVPVNTKHKRWISMCTRYCNVLIQRRKSFML